MSKKEERRKQLQEFEEKIVPNLDSNDCPEGYKMVNGMCVKCNPSNVDDIDVGADEGRSPIFDWGDLSDYENVKRKMAEYACKFRENTLNDKLLTEELKAMAEYTDKLLTEELKASLIREREKIDAKGIQSYIEYFS